MEAHSISELESALGHSFHKPELLRQALTHSSHAHEATSAAGDEVLSGAPRDTARGAPRRDNELLEFLGDAVLGLVASEALFQRFPERHEGELSKLRAHLVSAGHLVEVARELNLGAYLQLGRGEAKSGGSNKAAILVDALEAVIAALFLDAGLEATQKFVWQRILDPELRRLTQQSGAGEFEVTDYKSALQESVQSLGRPQPRYVLASEAGPDHSKTFTVELQLHINRGNKPDYVTRAEGPSKKSAEQRAARQALEHLKSADEKV